MSLQEEWKNMTYEDSSLSSLITRKSLNQVSKHPLEKLKNNLLVNALWGFAISLGYCGVMLAFPKWQIVLCLAVVLLFTLWSTTRALQLRKQLKAINMNGHSLLQELEIHYQHLRTWLRIQQQMGLLVYPIAATGGFILGVTFNSGRSVEEIFTTSRFLIAMLIMVVVMTPLGYLLAKWMFRKSFGVYMDQLKEHIDRLSETD